MIEKVKIGFGLVAFAQSFYYEVNINHYPSRRGGQASIIH